MTLVGADQQPQPQAGAGDPGRVETALDGAALALAGHRLVNLAWCSGAWREQGETYGASAAVQGGDGAGLAEHFYPPA